MNYFKITIATGIFPPDIGGPATYSHRITEEFLKLGHDVRVVTYSSGKNQSAAAERIPPPPQNWRAGKNQEFALFKIPRKHSLPVRYFLYFWKLWKISKDADFIYAFDAFSAGIPACVATRIRRKKFIIRLGGDFAWEKYLDKTGEKIILRDYYEKKIYRKQKIHHWILKKVLESADHVIFSSNLQRDIYLKRFVFLKDKSSVIQNTFVDFCNRDTLQNPFCSTQGGVSQSAERSGAPSNDRGVEEVAPLPCGKKGFGAYPNYILFAGRFINMKNIDSLISAFVGIAEKHPDLKLVIAGEGPRRKNYESRIRNYGLDDKILLGPPYKHRELLAAIQNSLFCVLPSLTDISPNFAFDCLSVGKPLILTKESEYFKLFPDLFVFCDPLDVKDIENKIEFLLNERNYQSQLAKIFKLSYNRSKRSFKDIAEEHIEIINKILIK